MAGFRIKLLSSGMDALLKSSEVRADLHDRMERSLSQAQSNAPVASGEYRDGLHLVDATTDRAVVRLVSNAPHALLVEANTGTLARALDAAG